MGMSTRNTEFTRSAKWRLTIDLFTQTELETLSTRLNNLTCDYVHIWASPQATDFDRGGLLCQCHNADIIKCISPRTTIRGYFETETPITVQDAQDLVGVASVLYMVTPDDECTERGLPYCTGSHVFSEDSGMRRVHLYPEGVTVVSRLQRSGRRTVVKFERWGNPDNELERPEFAFFYRAYRSLARRQRWQVL
ncbi:hypothetical protein DPEC_G00068240 [Dallia pectoralis]|uniref:Uncharacterized protein n=1 Tax=Dallia pectoralis TaxID=75939 RepID=A0ACC2H1L7_DALPE|nr:hypothetical protein DPEC_G00068240 [Dallia pectoralis]